MGVGWGLVVGAGGRDTLMLVMLVMVVMVVMMVV